MSERFEFLKLTHFYCINNNIYQTSFSIYQYNTFVPLLSKSIGHNENGQDVIQV